MVVDAWNEAKGLAPGLKDKLRFCSQSIKSWNVYKFGNVQKEINFIKRKLLGLKNSPRTTESASEEKVLSDRLDEWFAQEELLWKQRSRSDWLNDEDKNTVFFKIKATKRRDKKFIELLEKEDGSTVTEQKLILEEFVNYFKSLFSRDMELSNLDRADMMDHIQPRVSKTMNVMLLEPFSKEEISSALFQMHPDKAPGIDGFSSLFFQNF